MPLDGNDSGVEEKPQIPTFPDGGARAWSVAVGAAGVLFCTFGYANGFGYVPKVPGDFDHFKVSTLRC